MGRRHFSGRASVPGAVNTAEIKAGTFWVYCQVTDGGRSTAADWSEGTVTFAGATPFQRGDPNADAQRNITDAIYILGFLFGGEPAKLECAASGDLDDNGVVNITDAVFLLDSLFTGGDLPALECKVDLTLHLPCRSYPHCE